MLQKVTNFAVNFEYTSERKKIFLVVALTDQDFGIQVQQNTDPSSETQTIKPQTIFSNYRSDATLSAKFDGMLSYTGKATSSFKLHSHKYTYSDFYVV